MDEERRMQRRLLYYQNLSIIDDIVMSEVFKDCPEAVEAILEPLLGIKGLKIQESRIQETIPNAPYYSPRFDVLAFDEEGNRYDIEFQRESRAKKKNLLYLRSAFYAATLRSRSLNQGDHYDQAPWVYVIFFLEKDLLGMGKPIYLVRRDFKEEKEAFEDRECIVFVNCSYEDEETELGRLIHDITCTEEEKLHNKVLASRLKGVKWKTRKGGNESMNQSREIIHQIEEEWYQEGVQTGLDQGRLEGRLEGHLEGRQEGENKVWTQLILQGLLTVDQVSAQSGMSEEEVLSLVEKAKANKA